jgi:hypothetical protein
LRFWQENETAGWSSWPTGRGSITVEEERREMGKKVKTSQNLRKWYIEK